MIRLDMIGLFSIILMAEQVTLLRLMILNQITMQIVVVMMMTFRLVKTTSPKTNVYLCLKLLCSLD